jgi:hypothetical protein
MDVINIPIAFEQQDQNFLAQVCGEVLGGGSTQIIQNILGHSYLEATQRLASKVRSQAKSTSASIDLTAEEWRVLYESINAVIYGLGLVNYTLVPAIICQRSVPSISKFVSLFGAHIPEDSGDDQNFC